MKIAVTDTETTGTEDKDQVMEIAVIVVDGSTGQEESRWSSLVKPDVPCSYGARATHHILDRELEGAPSILDLLDNGNLTVFDEGAVAAHNAEFDVRLLRQSGCQLDNPVICTWRCARQLWPEAPGFSNQVLRYWLGLDDKYGDLNLEGLPPHRALADTLVTSRLVMEMLKLKYDHELVELTKAPILIKTVGFGKHRGVEFANVPRDYLRWLVGQDFDADTLYTAQHWLAR